jgi:UDP-N-acetylmuramoyl-L-alanyl-D-glutamate--2,6-diaminopimelate ligase
VPLVGGFQVSNILCATGLLAATGQDCARLGPLLETLEPVCGRLEKVSAAGHPFAVFVDYAHTPDALQKALQSLRAHTSRRLCAVFGCGGDRDAGKRPLMGRIAGAYADDVIITDDNPRTEDAGTIRAAILAACPSARDIGDRRQAIHTAIRAAKPGDTILIAGKGHEQGQTVGDEILPFSDQDCVREAL